MTTSYTGVKTGVQAPDTAPALGKAPTLLLPADGEDLNVASIYQGLKSIADHVALGAFFDVIENAWWPGFGQLVAHAHHFVGGSYESTFDAPTTLGQFAFVKGRGLELVNQTPNVKISSGFVGVYHATATPSVATAAPPLRWAVVPSQTKACALATAGQERYSLITVTIDASTNAPTITLTDGTSAGIGTAAIPATPVGHAVIGWTRQTDAAIVAVYDQTIPLGSLDSQLIVARLGSFGSNWAASGGNGYMVSSGVGSLVIPLCGDPRARLVELQVQHALTAGATMALVSYGAGVTPTDLTPAWLKTAGSGFTADGLYQETSFGVGSTPNLVAPPVWGHGAYIKQSGAPFAALDDRTLALSITCANSGDKVHGVRATFARG